MSPLERNLKNELGHQLRGGRRGHLKTSNLGMGMENKVWWCSKRSWKETCGKVNLLYSRIEIPFFIFASTRLMGKCLYVMGKSLFFSRALWWVKVPMGKSLMGKSRVEKLWWVNVLMGKCLETFSKWDYKGPLHRAIFPHFFCFENVWKCRNTTF